MQDILALDLKDDPLLIHEYEQYHQAIWPEVAILIREAGIVEMEIFRLGTRLVMRMVTDDEVFSPEHYEQLQRTHPRIQEWESLMDRYQIPTPWSKDTAKWTSMKKIFDLSSQ